MADNENGTKWGAWGAWFSALLAVVLTAVLAYLTSSNTFEARLSRLEGRPVIDPSRVSVLENQQLMTDRRLERIESKIDVLLERLR